MYIDGDNTVCVFVYMGRELKVNIEFHKFNVNPLHQYNPLIQYKSTTLSRNREPLFLILLILIQPVNSTKFSSTYHFESQITVKTFLVLCFITLVMYR